MTGNRVNPGKESIFNKFYDLSTRSKLYRHRSLPIADLKKQVSLTIRKTYEECLDEIAAAAVPAEFTDNPFHMKHSIFDVASIKFENLEKVREIPTFRTLFIDPAFSKENYSNAVGFCYVFTTDTGRSYFGTKEKVIGSKDFKGAVIKELAEYDIHYCFIEKGATSSFVREQVEEEAERVGLPVVMFEDLKPERGMSMEQRILSQVALFDYERMAIIRELQEPLMSQLATFDPKSMTTRKKRVGYDALDAFAYAVEWLYKNDKMLTNTHVGDSLGSEYFYPDSDFYENNTTFSL